MAYLERISCVTMMVVLVVGISVLMCGGGALAQPTISTTYPYSVSKHRVGPFSIGNEQASFAVPLAPYPSEAAGIVYWGKWLVYDANDKIVPHGKVFLHHIMLNGVVSGSSILVTGSSDERATFGPDLKYNFVMPTKGPVTVQGSVLLVGYFSQPTAVWIEYEVHYYTAAQMPPNPINVLSSACAITVNVPKLGAGQIFNQTAEWSMPVDGYLITGVGHLHVGGVAVRLIEQGTGTQVCTSPASHFTQDELPCFIECPNECSNGPTTYPALKHIEHCDIYRWYPAGTKFTMDVAYDAVCSFSGGHGHLYMWYAPAPRPMN